MKIAHPTDVHQLIDFLNTIGGETDYLTFGLNDFPISAEEEVVLINDCLKNNTSLILVGKTNNKIISQLYLEVSTQPRLAHIGHLGLSVSKAYWGKSVGTKMLAEAINWAKNKQLAKLQLQVRTDNMNAIHLYKKFAFSIEGTVTNSLRINNSDYDEFLMGLKLIKHQEDRNGYRENRIK